MDKRFMGVRELAEYMRVSEKTIYRMLNDNQLPFAVKIGGQWRFRSDTAEDWFSDRIKNEADNGKINYSIKLAEACRHGTVLYRIHGGDRDETLDAILEAVPLSSGFEHDKIKLSVLMRESLVSSCLKGAAVMTISPSYPVYMKISLVLLAFLEDPVDFKALDGQPARVIFLILGANSIEQAILEIRLRRLLMEEIFISNLLEQPGRKGLLQLIMEWEDKLLKGASR